MTFARVKARQRIMVLSIGGSKNRLQNRNSSTLLRGQMTQGGIFDEDGPISVMAVPLLLAEDEEDKDEEDADEEKAEE
jgi:hypothetical protein